MDFLQVTLKLLEGFWDNCLLFGETLLFALPLGLIVAFGSMSKFKPLKYLVKTFVWIIRGTPLMLQLFVVFYAPGLILNNLTPLLQENFEPETVTTILNVANFFIIDDRFSAAVFAFVINYACYFSEIYRGGIESISKGQWEAGQVLGMKKPQIFFKVVLLQVVKRIVPPMSNEIITLVKDTSLANVIAIEEINIIAKSFSSEGLIWPLFYTGVFFLIFNGVLTLLFGYIEKKLDYFKG